MEYIGYVKSAQLLNKNADNKSEWNVNLLQEIVGYWSTNLHLKVFYLMENIFGFFDNLKEDLNINVAQRKSINTVKLHFCGIIGFHIKISEKQSAKISLGML